MPQAKYAGERATIRPNARQVAATGNDGRLPDDDLRDILIRAGIAALQSLGQQECLAMIRTVTADETDAKAARDAMDRIAPGLMRW